LFIYLLLVENICKVLKLKMYWYEMIMSYTFHCYCHKIYLFLKNIIFNVFDLIILKFIVGLLELIIHCVYFKLHILFYSCPYYFGIKLILFVWRIVLRCRRIVCQLVTNSRLEVIFVQNVVCDKQKFVFKYLELIN